MHFTIPDESAVDAIRQCGAWWQVQHIAMTQQLLRAHLIKNGARVYPRGDLESHPCRNIGLDQTGNHIHRRPLGGQHQVNSSRPRLLRQAGNQFFDLLADDHHHVGKFVDHYDDIGKSRQFRGRFFKSRRLRVPKRVKYGRALVGRIFDFLVVPGQVAHTHRGHQAVTPLHFRHTPAQGVGGFFHVGHHRRQQVGNALINR